ncbi:MAG: hypothetical protein JW991_05315 [Candidatus Pacebacteria bacterium]|nr:hypothetical protein [Candidatus Paceibacterota bacterium]
MGRKLLNISFDKKEITALSEDSFVWFSFLSAFFLVFIISFLIFLNWNRLPPQLPLFFSRPWGEEQLGSPSELWLLPLISFLIIGFNLFLAIFLLRKEILIRRILSATALVITALCLFTTYKIINLTT